ncbi:hypothetical protein PF002_g32098 [Phytophthora fragariae]|uniref:Uncharacterized protein n=1 Tax=Phytophthora fragariae TaxID=53985 RepID=A0A6A3H2X6_9STRA|nr:hypothetical protein PF003_g26477 [Phytophthora fragariae]KAE8917657.1 hypothetical protein PF009_g32023 [Phytophthora fragariae]KAE8963577.1 hypothetical protein PF011_g28975 [Phytophthora fragariae]KAE9162491.1 hypothetical protein PF002_g32098 [Phytophthora fragariae]
MHVPHRRLRCELLLNVAIHSISATNVTGWDIAPCCHYKCHGHVQTTTSTTKTMC